MPAENRCPRRLVGQGSDTYDPVCALPLGHSGPCSRDAPSHREPPRDEEPVQQYVKDREACPLSTPCADVRVCSCGVDNRSPAPRDARDLLAEAVEDVGTLHNDLTLPEFGALVAEWVHAAGFSVVSREPTDEMIERAWEAWMTSGGDRRMILVPHLRAAIRAALSEGDER